MNDIRDIAAPAEPAGSQRQSLRASASASPILQAPASVAPLHSLAVQVPLLLVIALSLVISAGAWGLRSIVLHSFERLEIANAELDLHRFANGIDHEVAELAGLLSRIAEQRSGESGPERLDILPLEPAMTPADVPEVACLFDEAGRLISTDADDPQGTLLQWVNPTGFCALAEGHTALARARREGRAAGLFDADGTSFLIAMERVPLPASSDAAGQVLLLARLLSSEELAAIAGRMEVSIDFWSMNTPDLDVLEAAAGAALSLGAPFIVNKHSEDLLQVYWAFEDAGGEPAFLARANVFRDLREIGDETVLLSALAMGGVGVATILLSLVLVRSLMVRRLSRLTGRVLGMRWQGSSGRRLSEADRAFQRGDEIGVLARSFDDLLDELFATSQQLADVSYRAGRAEVTEGSLHNIGNALNSLMSSAEAARTRLQREGPGKIAQAARELAAGSNLTERQSKLAQFASLAAEEEVRRLDALKADIERATLHIARIEDILESQRRLGSDQDLATTTDLRRLIESAVQTLPEQGARKLTVRLGESLALQPPILCVQAVVLQVINNLLVNAAEAIERGDVQEGRIEISGRSLEVEGVAMVEIAIADNGIGLQPAELVQIFQRFYTTKTARGHGIGLHWCANVVASMGGQLYATSEGTGKGATLHLLLPASDHAGPAANM